jgi:hypothetical protein
MGGDCTFTTPNITCTKLNGFTVTLGGMLVTAGTFTTAANTAFAGAFPVILTSTASTNVTLPTSGTLATTANINTALPSATTSQVYAGSGAAGVATVIGTTGSGNAVLATSPTITSPTITSPTITLPLISGVTNGANAAAGNVGEVIYSSIPVGSAVSVSTAVPTNVTSVLLTAGDWDCDGNIVNNPSGTSPGVFTGGMSTVSNTLPTPPAGGYAKMGGAAGVSGQSEAIALSRQQYNISSSQTVYLVVNQSFSGGTMSVYGQIYCRRMR